MLDHALAQFLEIGERNGLLAKVIDFLEERHHCQRPFRLQHPHLLERRPQEIETSDSGDDGLRRAFCVFSISNDEIGPDYY
jgi:hypothetical protein